MTAKHEGKALTTPNRLIKVNEICKAHPEAFPQDSTNDEKRLNLLKTEIIPQLNEIDNGNWGYMTKTDQGGKVPCDILMWKPTNGVVDCMTGTGATWIEHGAPPDEWVWTAVPSSGEVPEPIPPSTDNIPYDNDEREVKFGQACNSIYFDNNIPVDPGMIAVHSARNTYDFYVLRMPDPECNNKHINEFRAVYSLPPI